HPLAAAEATDGTGVTCHLILLRPTQLNCSCKLERIARERCGCAPYTRRRLRGRQPLCGIGVTSRMVLMSMPLACSERIADSRPAPGPVTSTSRVRMPASRAATLAFCAAIWAANGVPLREPLKPTLPADDQPTTLPSGSVRVTMVLLKVAWMWAT